MTSKTFEIRDRGTFIPVLAIRLDPATEADRFLISRAGYGKTPELQAGYILMIKLIDASKSNYDPYKWTDPELREAHLHIRANFDSLPTGDVIDLEFLRGETSVKKLSEAIA